MPCNTLDEPHRFSFFISMKHAASLTVQMNRKCYIPMTIPDSLRLDRFLCTGNLRRMYMEKEMGFLFHF